MRRAQHHQAVRPPRRLVARQQARGAGILAGMHRRDHQFRQRRHVAEAKVQPLPRDRVDAMRRIPHQSEPFGRVAGGVHGRQRIGPAPPDRRHRAEVVPQPRRDLPAIGRIVHRQRRRGDRRALGPDDGADVRMPRDAVHRQLREGAVGQELLQRDIVVRLLVRDGPDDAHAMVVEPRHRDARLAAQRRVAALGADHKARPDLLPIRQAQHHALRPAFHLRSRGGEDTQMRQVRQARVQRDAQGACLDHPAEGFFPHIGMVEMQGERRRRFPRPPVGDTDAQDRAGFLRQPVPHPGGGQQPLGGQRDGIGPPVEVGQFHRRQRRGVHHRRADAGGGQRRGQGGADRSGADDADLDLDGRAHARNLGARRRRASMHAK